MVHAHGLFDVQPLSYPILLSWACVVYADHEWTVSVGLAKGCHPKPLRAQIHFRESSPAMRFPCPTNLHTDNKWLRDHEGLEFGRAS